MPSVIRPRQAPFKKLHLCPCGSRRQSTWQYDARGIALCRTCAKCHGAKMAKYRPEVLTNPNYHTDEPIEED